MAVKKTQPPENLRKRKRIVPTRAAGTPAFENPADELFAAAFAHRKQPAKVNDQDSFTLPYPSTVESAVDYPTLPEPGVDGTKTLAAVSPSRNFTKFSNSILKQAIPDGLFRGQSKHTYDVLYLHSRGAINPVRQIQLTKIELVKLTGLEIKTIQRHLSFLRTSGLIIVDSKVGDHKGAIYEVNIPEEITLPYPTLLQSSVPEPSVGKVSVVSTPDPSIVSTTVGYGKTVENNELNNRPNTSLKTSTENDDDALANFAAVLNEASRKLTKKGLRADEKGKWEELAELLVLELQLAAARTNSISSIPAFLTEHLRRRLTKPFSKTPSASSNARKNTAVSREVETEEYKADPLTEQGRETVLKTFREYIDKGQREFVMGFENTYTPEDWAYLIEKLGG